MATNRNHSNEIYSSSRKKRKKKMQRKDKVLVGISIALIIISAAVVGTVALLNGRFFQGSDESLSSDIQTPTEIKEDVVNFLVCGIDDEEGRDMGERTDVIMVVNYDIKAGKVHVLQIPRDTYVEDVRTNKINAVYGSDKNGGGINGLAEEIHQDFALTIDHYATIQMDGFKSLVDAVGGVDMNVPVSFELNGVTLEAGPQHLNGDQAEAIVRERHSYGTQDIGRLQTQRLFIASLLDKMLSMGKMDLVGLVPTLSQYITTDLSIGEMLGYADIASSLKMDNMTMHLLPGEGYQEYRGAPSYYTAHLQETADLLNQYFRPYSEDVPAEDLKCIELANTITDFDNNQGVLGDILGTDSGKSKPTSSDSSSSSSSEAE